MDFLRRCFYICSSETRKPNIPSSAATSWYVAQKRCSGDAEWERNRCFKKLLGCRWAKQRCGRLDWSLKTWQKQFKRCKSQRKVKEIKIPTYHWWLSAQVGFSLTASSPMIFPERKTNLNTDALMQDRDPQSEAALQIRMATGFPEKENRDKYKSSERTLIVHHHWMESAWFFLVYFYRMNVTHAIIL